MRKLFLLSTILFFIGIQNLSAQCTPVPFSGPSLMNPDTAQGLEPAYANNLYNQVIHLRVPADTIYQGLVITIDSAGILSVTGMPTNISWTSNSPSNFWPGNSYGCILIQGTPTPAEVGQYILSVVVSVNALGTALPLSISYDFEILADTTNGFSVSKLNDFKMLQNQPNPFSNTTSINYYMPEASDVIFKVYDILGNCVMQKSEAVSRGKNTIQFERNQLAAGMYVYELNYGQMLVRKRMIIQ